MVPVETQVFFFLGLVLLGVLMGFLFDVYRELLRGLRLGTLGTNISDLLIWIVLSAVFFFLLVNANYSEVRLYAFAGLALGMAAYFNTVSKTCRAAVRFFLGLGTRVLGFLWMLVKTPVLILQKALMLPGNLISLALLKTLAPARKVGRAIRSFLKCLLD